MATSYESLVTMITLSAYVDIDTVPYSLITFLRQMLKPNWSIPGIVQYRKKYCFSILSLVWVIVISIAPSGLGTLESEQRM